MASQKYLIDTNVIIDYLGQRLPVSGMEFLSGIVNATPTVSVISKIELLGFNTTDEHAQLLINFIGDCIVLDLTDTVVENCIQIRKRFKTKLPDAIIASTALTYNLVLLTRNGSDFKNITGLEVIDPHHL